ncbi:hypothetical protein C8R45DRAFT_947759 [Mycena sanguinolenta]|nr:hypothetical protein C8R45DRAFT_947759 [Mycena sanguinolenta]
MITFDSMPTLASPSSRDNGSLGWVQDSMLNASVSGVDFDYGIIPLLSAASSSAKQTSRVDPTPSCAAKSTSSSSKSSALWGIARDRGRKRRGAWRACCAISNQIILCVGFAFTVVRCRGVSVWVEKRPSANGGCSGSVLEAGADMRRRAVPSSARKRQHA